MKRIFYGNITYACNNSCRQCISHSVKEGCSSVLSINDFRSAAECYQVNKDDIWNINGGEPTLSPVFNEIINFCYELSPHIIVYSNGRNLGNVPLSIIDKIERIIVPLYGASGFHDDYVNCSGAFSQTLNSLAKLIYYDNNLIELKLLLNEDGAIEELQKTDSWSLLFRNTHFSVTRVLSGYDDNTVCSDKVAHLAELLIDKLVKAGKEVRFYDIPFCMFSLEFQHRIESIYRATEIYDPYVIHILPNKGSRIEYYAQETDIKKECARCKHHCFCTMVMRNYFCPQVNSDECTRVTE